MCLLVKSCSLHCFLFVSFGQNRRLSVSRARNNIVKNWISLISLPRSGGVKRTSKYLRLDGNIKYAYAGWEIKISNIRGVRKVVGDPGLLGVAILPLGLGVTGCRPSVIRSGQLHEVLPSRPENSRDKGAIPSFFMLSEGKNQPTVDI